MKVLGFWDKLFTKCVAVEEYQTLSDTVEDLNKNVSLKEKVISDLKDTIGSKEERIKNLVQQVNNGDNRIMELSSNNSSITNELSNTKDKLDVTLKLLSDAQSELKVTNQQLENRPVVTEDYSCHETTTEEVTEGAKAKDEVPTSDELAEDTTSDEDKIGDGTFEKEDVLKGSDVVVTAANKLEKFINGLTNVQKKELKDDILKGHANDKRLTKTLKNWCTKHPLLDTQVYFMFKTALNRRRGKQQLDAWYKKYDAM